MPTPSSCTLEVQVLAADVVSYPAAPVIYNWVAPLEPTPAPGMAAEIVELGFVATLLEVIL